MKSEKREIFVYTAIDGKEFLHEFECNKYEKFLQDLEYFAVCHSPKLTETFSLTKVSVVAVYSPEYLSHRAIVENWCVNTKGFPIIIPSVRGSGYQPGFKIIPDNGTGYVKDMWNNFKYGARTHPYSDNIFEEKVFLSPEYKEGFPENFNFVKEWGLDVNKK